MSLRSLLGLIEGLEKAIRSLRSQSRGTEWLDYYDKTNYSSAAFQHKKELVEAFLEASKPKVVWDLGANIGFFSRLASNKGILTIAFDNDPLAVEKNYLESVAKNETHILPLLMDLTNPSPGIGWETQERMSLLERGPADTALALALIHHLAISHNLPFRKIAHLLSEICRFLIIEFVAKEDSQVQKLLKTRENIFGNYKKEFFEKEFSLYFRIRKRVKIKNSKRIMYLMEKKRA